MKKKRKIMRKMLDFILLCIEKWGEMEMRRMGYTEIR